VRDIRLSVTSPRLRPLSVQSKTCGVGVGAAVLAGDPAGKRDADDADVLVGSTGAVGGEPFGLLEVNDPLEDGAKEGRLEGTMDGFALGFVLGAHIGDLVGGGP
jgi:hypothetical protein